MIVLLGNAFLFGFGLDALLSVLDALQPLPVLSALRSTVAGMVFFAVVPVWALCALSPKLPARVFLPVLLATVWLNLGGAPVVLWSGLEALARTLSFVQLAVAAWMVFAIRSSTGGRWYLSDDAVPTESVSPVRLLAVGGGTFLLGPPALLAYLLIAALCFLHAMTAGFLAFDLSGIQLAERTYAKDGQEIRLIGMMHVGEGAQYEALFDSLAREGTVVLEEGVTDEGNLIADRFSYENVAERLGLDQQGRISQYFEERGSEWPHIRHADLDVADFSEKTRELLGKIASVLQADDLAEMMRRAEAMTVTPEVAQAARHDAIDLRNEHLLEQIEAAREDYARIAVPWGAMHMPWLEEQLRAQGFELTDASEHPLVSWARIRAALAEPRTQGADG